MSAEVIVLVAELPEAADAVGEYVGAGVGLAVGGTGWRSGC